jgi:hypothetical protein
MLYTEWLGIVAADTSKGSAFRGGTPRTKSSDRHRTWPDVYRQRNLMEHGGDYVARQPPALAQAVNATVESSIPPII